MLDLAVTKIWDVKSHLTELVKYVSNQEKTDVRYNEDTLKALVSYGVNDLKTEERKYVSGIGCKTEDAAIMMVRLNALSSSKSDTVAYHGYQSFAPGEVTPDVAHLIGVELARELWGKNFPIVIATHLDRGHIHNHFAIGATGKDGKRFHDCKETYEKMKETSDRLCRQYGLSVVEHPKRKQTRDIGEIKAEEEGRYTVRGQIRRDIDIAVSQRDSWQYFVPTFEALGYSMEYRGKYLRIRPDESSKWFRMDKLGEGYTVDDVKERLRENFLHGRSRYFQPFEPKKYEKPKGLRALYVYYQFLLGHLPKTKPESRLAYDLLKEDSKKARLYSREATLLGQHHIDTAEDLRNYTEEISEKFISLAKKRAGLRNRLRRMHDTEAMQPIKDEIAGITATMAELRRDMKLCEDIAERSGAMEAVINLIYDPAKEQEYIREQEKKRREKSNDEHIR